jgi:hypothetical protein
MGYLGTIGVDKKQLAVKMQKRVSSRRQSGVREPNCFDSKPLGVTTRRLCLCWSFVGTVFADPSHLRLNDKMGGTS